jgi:S-formylglutathione hydrolase FrmB
MSAEDYFGSFENTNTFEDDPDGFAKKLRTNLDSQSHYARNGYALVQAPSDNNCAIWTTKDDRKIMVSQMTDSHLYNAYKKFDDERLAREILLRLFAKEIKQ